MKKINLCFIGWDHQVCREVSDELTQYFGDYLSVHTWCLQQTPHHPETVCDIYLATVSSAAEYAEEQLPPGCHPIIAERSLNAKGIAKLLELEKEARVLVIAASRSGALTTIRLIGQLGIDGIAMFPYYHGCSEEVLSSIDTAVITGQNTPPPPNIRHIIDLGPKSINLSTYVELLSHIPEAPRNLVNEIAQSYIIELFQAGIRQQKMAQSNYLLRQELDIVLDTVDDGVFSVNAQDQITFFNKRAEQLLGIPADEVVGKYSSELFPALGLRVLLEENRRDTNKICKLRGELFVVSYTPLADTAQEQGGGVVSVRKAEDILVAEKKVRHKLFAQGYLARHRFGDIAGSSPALIHAKELAQRFSGANLPILLEGETGTGKELFAQSIHNSSPRRANAFVAVNFAALTESLVESELFGYVDGAFTGARRGGQMGLFEQAHRGTVFLDEIGDVSLEIQKKLLRVLENQEVRRIGANMVTRVDVRIIAATNRNLLEIVESGGFRADLFYRLGTLPIRLPPLRERKEDILPLLHLFLRRFQSSPILMEESLKEFLQCYGWPGNIRELQNVAQYLTSLLTTGGNATLKDLPAYMRAMEADRPHLRAENPKFNPFGTAVQELGQKGKLVPVFIALEELHQTSGAGAGLGRTKLRSRLAEYGYQWGEYPVRELLSLLSSLGFCSCGTTRQGTKILPKGESFRQYLLELGVSREAYNNRKNQQE